MASFLPQPRYLTRGSSSDEANPMEYRKLKRLPLDVTILDDYHVGRGTFCLRSISPHVLNPHSRIKPDARK